MPYTDSRRARRAGFTLIELMVAMVIAGGLAAAVFTLLNSQSRMVAAQGGKHEAQQNVRGALEVLGSELRGAIPGALLEAQAQSITFMQPRAWGLVCAAAGTSVTALFPDAGALDAWAANEANGILLNTGTLAAPAWLPNPQVAAGRARITAAQVVAGGAAAAACAGLNGQGTAVAVQLTSSVPLIAPQGTLLTTYTLTRYDVAQDNGASWLRRNNGVTNGVYNQQPLAGPVDPANFAFTYFAGNPAVAVAAPGTNAAQLALLRMVRVQVTANSTQRLNGLAQSSTGAVTVLLRN